MKKRQALKIFKRWASVPYGEASPWKEPTLDKAYNVMRSRNRLLHQAWKFVFWSHQIHNSTFFE